jgi:hypothetical protein
MSLEVVFSPSTMEKKENKKKLKEGRERERSAEHKNWKGKVITGPRGAGI